MNIHNSDFYVAGIGASAGGLKPICQFFQHIPSRPGVAFVVIMHLPVDFKSKLDLSLSRHTSLPVIMLHEEYFAIDLYPDNIYILPGNLKAIVKGDKLFLHQRSADELINTTINDFLFSLASSKKEKAIGIILSGAGTDGAKGIYEIHKNHGIVLVQTPASAEHTSMPFASIDINHPDKILPPTKLGRALLEVIKKHEKK